MKVRALAALLLVAFPAVAIAQGRVPGVTDTEIVIGLTAPLSGPAAIYGNRLSGLCRRGGLPRHYSVTKLGAQKLAVFYQNDDWGKEVMDGVSRAMKTLGGKATLAAAVLYEVSDRELGRQAVKFRESGADTLSWPRSTLIQRISCA
jgi:ABC-type branched-subunit amino acid transport system substrate-binding protein